MTCAWGGIVFAVLFFVGFLGIAHFVPPLPPSGPAAATAAIFRGETNEIRTGLLLCYVGCVFFLAFGAAISGQTRRITGAPTAIVHLQVAAYAAAVLLIVLPIIIWWTAAYRPDERSIEVIQILNDLGWISFLVGWVPFVTWYMATGAAILCDTSAAPIYPRWSGYVGLFLGLAQSSASFLIYFTTGPFAWDGLFSWWLPASEFFLWFVVMTVLTVRAINKQYREIDGST